MQRRIGSGTGRPCPVFLLGYHGVKRATHVSLDRSISSNTLDGALKLAPPVLELVRGERVQRMLGRPDGRRLGGHRRLVPRRLAEPFTG